MNMARSHEVTQFPEPQGLPTTSRSPATAARLDHCLRRLLLQECAPRRAAGRSRSAGRTRTRKFPAADLGGGKLRPIAPAVAFGSCGSECLAPPLRPRRALPELALAGDPAPGCHLERCQFAWLRPPLLRLDDPWLEQFKPVEETRDCGAVAQGGLRLAHAFV